MDLNLGHATILRYFTTSYVEGLQDGEGEQLSIRPKRLTRRPGLALLRHWAGARIVRLGERVGQAATTGPADNAVTS